MESIQAEHVITHQAFTLSAHNPVKDRYPSFLSGQLILLLPEPPFCEILWPLPGQWQPWRPVPSYWFRVRGMAKGRDTQKQPSSAEQCWPACRERPVAGERYSHRESLAGSEARQKQAGRWHKTRPQWHDMSPLIEPCLKLHLLLDFLAT